MILLTPRLVHNLHTMSLAKAVPEGIRDHECKRIILRECSPVSYVPNKDPIQETVSALKNDQSLKTTIGRDAELRLPIWHCGICEAFIMHVSTAIDVIKKQGTFKVYAEAHELYVEQCDLAKQVKAFLAELGKATSDGERTSKKSSKKTKEEMAMADTSEPKLHAIYQRDLEKAKFATETAKAKEEFTAKAMFRFYGNVLPADAKYEWNKIIKEQMASDPYVDLQGISKKGPRGPLHKTGFHPVWNTILRYYTQNKQNSVQLIL
jgi:hypothetical protein